MAEVVPVSSWNIHVGPDQSFDPLELVKDESLTTAWVEMLSRETNRNLFREFDGEWISRSDFLALSTKAAKCLRSSGLRQGDRVVLSASTSVNMLAYYVAALRLSLIVVPINTSYTQTEVSYIIKSVKPSATITDSKQRAQWILDAASDPNFVAPFVGPGSDLPPPSGNIVTFDPSREIPELGLDRALELDKATPDSIALIVYTSGTTGHPKGAMLTHGNLLSCAKSLNMAWQWTEEDLLVLVLPLFHLHGLGVGINGTLCAGSSAVLLPKFDPELISHTLDQEPASMFFGVPTMYQRMLEAGVLPKLSTLRLCVSGSAPMSVGLHNAAELDLGKTVLERYGATEVVIVCSNPLSGKRIPGTVGMPIPGVTLGILKETGEIFVSGPTVFVGYLSDAEATERAFPVGDGWFATGDLGAVDENGYVSIYGRSKDLIISGGYNVYPREIEEVIEKHQAVREVAVVGRPSEFWGEEVVAFVVPQQPIDEFQVIKYAGKYLAKYKIPKSIVFVDSLPKNALGKILYKELRDRFG